MEITDAKKLLDDSKANAHMTALVEEMMAAIDSIIHDAAEQGCRHLFIARTGVHHSLWHSLFYPDTFWIDDDNADELHFPVVKYQATIEHRLRQAGYEVEWDKWREYILIEW